MEVFETLRPAQSLSAIALGCFDGLHLGHQQVISSALHAVGLTPTVFTFDENPMRALGRTPPPMLMTNEIKAHLLEKLGVARLYRISFSSIMAMEPEAFVKQILVAQCRAKKICCGYNFRFGRGGRGNETLLRELCAACGVTVEIVPPVSDRSGPISSSRIRAALLAGEAEAAASMLGRPFGYDFEVVHGRHLGTELGTPTINQRFPQGFIQPKFGVYASLCDIDGKQYYGVTNIGVKPTVGSHEALSETWIPEYSGDLYGKRIPVSLLSFLRPERKFENLEALRTEIQKNRIQAEKVARNKKY